MPRKTDSNNPADWLFLAESDLEGIRDLATRQLACHLCSSKLAEVVEKVFKAELLRCGWFLEKTHDLMRLLGGTGAASPGTNGCGGTSGAQSGGGLFPRALPRL